MWGLNKFIKRNCQKFIQTIIFASLNTICITLLLRQHILLALDLFQGYIFMDDTYSWMIPEKEKWVVARVEMALKVPGEGVMPTTHNSTN